MKITRDLILIGRRGIFPPFFRKSNFFMMLPKTFVFLCVLPLLAIFCELNTLTFLDGKLQNFLILVINIIALCIWIQNEKSYVYASYTKKELCIIFTHQKSPRITDKKTTTLEFHYSLLEQIENNPSKIHVVNRIDNLILANKLIDKNLKLFIKINNKFRINKIFITDEINVDLARDFSYRLLIDENALDEISNDMFFHTFCT